LSKFDRYVLSQYLLIFGFFALILVAVFWINRAVSLFDRLIGGGQSAMVFLEFSTLALPNLIRMVVPMATFAAAVYVTNRLNTESELTVMQATGSSPWRMARPALVFGLIVAAMMSVLTHLLLPASVNELAKRELEVSRNLTAALLSEGQFLHPADGVTFYIGSVAPDGTLNDVFLSDRRSDSTEVTYTAAKAFLVRQGAGANLIMVDGLAQRLDRHRGEAIMSTTNFKDFSYDISALVERSESRRRSLRGFSTAELITDRPALTEAEGYTPGQMAEELHLRFARALICVSVALIGFSTLLLGSFSRFGVWRQVLLAFIILILLEVLRGVVSEPILNDARLWPLAYLPMLLGLLLSVLFLYLAAYPLRRVRPPSDLDVAPEAVT
jgi:lipopolysaccharide export system permease protein